MPEAQGQGQHPEGGDFPEGRAHASVLISLADGDLGIAESRTENHVILIQQAKTLIYNCVDTYS